MTRILPSINLARIAAVRSCRRVAPHTILYAAWLGIGLFAGSIQANAQSGVNRQHAFQRGAGIAVAPRTLALLRQMRHAEHALTLSGEQVTVLYSERGRAPEQSEQTILFDSGQGYRCEYHTPDRLAGQVIVSRPDGYWHSVPRRHLLMIGPPRPRRIGAQIGSAFRALRSGAAQATLIGTDTIAGRLVDIIVISAAAIPPVPTAKLWVDPATGAQLRTELYDAQGALRSVSYFTQLTYAPNFQPDAFAAPSVQPGTRTVTQQPATKLNRLPTDAEAGFHVLVPAEAPSGYVFESASIFHYTARGDQGVTLRYRSSWSLLSLFERVAAAKNAQTDSAASPRAGTVVVHRNGMQLIAIGSLGNDELLSVLNSMR